MTEGKIKSNIKPEPSISRTECLPPPPGPKRNNEMNSINYLHVDEKSHFWTDINQMLEWLKYINDCTPNAIEYLKEGLKNTLKQGYNIQPNHDSSVQTELFTTHTYPEGTTISYTNG